MNFFFRRGPELREILHAVLTQGHMIMSAIDNLNAAVAANTNAVNSAVALLGTLKALSDPTHTQAAADAVAANTAALEAAVAANTPV